MARQNRGAARLLAERIRKTAGEDSTTPEHSAQHHRWGERVGLEEGPRPLEFDARGFPLAQRRPSFAQRVGRLLNGSSPRLSGAPANTRDDAGNAPTGAPSAIVRQAVAAAAEGDESAMHFLYVRYIDDLQGQIERMVGGRRAAETLAREVLTKAIRTYEGPEPAFPGWVFSFARRLALDHVRSCRETRSSAG